jgi:flagellar hook-associated protein 2
MGTITSGIGLVSGINTTQLIDGLMSIESQPVTNLQQQVQVLQAKQTAFQAISAKLLAVKMSADTFTKTDTFNSTTATSSDTSVLDATTTASAAAGTYSFSVARLVSTQQAITRGYADASATAMPAGTLSFAFGGARLDSQTALSQLNGGSGVPRGRIRITDRSGASAVIDLSQAVTVDDVLNTINNSSGINVTASISGDGLKLTDNTGGAGTLAAANVGTTNTAAALGLTAASVGGTLTGAKINTISANSLVAQLNDGTGVRSSSTGVPDFQVTRRDGTTFNVDLAPTDQTLGAVIQKINAAGGGTVTAAVNSDGTGIQLTDTTGGGGSLSVAALNSSNAAADLGILDSTAGATLTGSRLIAAIDSKLVRDLKGLSTATLGTISITNRAGATSGPIDLSAAGSVQDVIAAINGAGAGVTASLNSSGNGLLLTDTTGQTGSDLVVSDLTGNAAAALNLAGPVSSSTKDSGNLHVRYLSESTSLASLNGGKGVTRGKFTVTDSRGVSSTVDLTQGNEVTIQDVLDEINSRGLSLTARINNDGSGILLQDTGPGTVAIQVAEAGSTTAQDLGILGTAKTPGASIDGSFEKTVSLTKGTITAASTLASLNGTGGVHINGAQPDFRITRRDGTTFDVQLAPADTTIQSVIDKISAASGGNVTAGLNADGTGLNLTDSTSGSSIFRVQALNNSSAAGDLGFLATGGADSNNDGTIQGGAVVAGLTLNDAAAAINAAGINVSAAIINDGSAANPFRLSITGTQSGKAGAFVIDDHGLGMQASTLVDAQDAVVFYGSADPSRAVAITSTSNTLSTLIPGVTVNLKNVSASPVSLTISQDNSTVSDSVSAFVTAFNSAMDSLNQYDTYDATTQQKGLLLGDSTVASIRSALFAQINNTNGDLTSQFNNLAQIGITVGSGSHLQFNQATFSQAMQTNRDAVQKLFTFKTTATGSDGTVTTTASGIGVRIDQLLQHLTDSSTGTIVLHNNALNDQITLDNQRITDLNTLLAAKKATLQAEFNNMETVLAGLQSQGAALNSLAALTTSLISSSNSGSSSSSSSSSTKTTG